MHIADVLAPIDTVSLLAMIAAIAAAKMLVVGAVWAYGFVVAWFR